MLTCVQKILFFNALDDYLEKYIRLLKWILAYVGLSAAWHIEDGSNLELPLAVAETALSLLNRRKSL